MTWLLIAQSAAPPSLDEHAEASYLLLLSLTVLVLLIVFALGAYVMIRMGRALRQPSLGGKPTEYTDAWSQYRVSEEDIERATHEPFDPHKRPPADDNDDRPTSS